MSRCCFAPLFSFAYERGWDSALWLQLKSLSVQSSHGRANAPDRGRWGNFLKMAGGGGGGGGVGSP